MGESIYVDAETLRDAGLAFGDLASSVDAVRRRLVATLDAEGACWGTDTVGATFSSKYDAGGVLVWLDESNWAKLAVEQSPAGEPTIVSVVTRGVSDDCNSWAAESPAWLRVARIGPAYAFHVSTDGGTWSLVRHFALAADGDPLVGFVAQAPTGERCTATFEFALAIG